MDNFKDHDGTPLLVNPHQHMILTDQQTIEEWKKRGWLDENNVFTEHFYEDMRSTKPMDR